MTTKTKRPVQRGPKAVRWPPRQRAFIVCVCRTRNYLSPWAIAHIGVCSMRTTCTKCGRTINIAR